MSLSKILLIEDDRSIASALAYALKKTYQIDYAASGKTAMTKIVNGVYDLIVLDLNLPDIPGFFICQQVRDRDLMTPILVLSGEDKTLTKITLLDGGANDYLTKPFSLGEFTARLRVLLRSHQKALKQQSPLPKLLTKHGICLDRRNFSVSRDGVTIQLRRKEFDILQYLMEHADQVVSREALSHYLWADNASHWTNTITVHVKALRDKIDRPFADSLIHTIHGRGYKFGGSLKKHQLMKV
jgi:DNA-binding response OmpR family regulator